MSLSSRFVLFSLPRPLRVAGLGLLLPVATCTLLAQNRPPADDAANNNGSRRRGGTQGTAASSQDDPSGRRNMSPQDMQARMMTAMRERFGVTDDEEWNLISARIQKVSELRRSAGGGAGGFTGFRGGSPGGADTSNRGGRSTRGGSPEVEALQAAINDKLPDAEIKSRLERLRDSRKSTEANLLKAQEELRAVLSVRQEAAAVIFGFLP